MRAIINTCLERSKKKSWLQGCSEIEAHPDLNHAERNLWNGTDRMLGLDHSLNLSEVDKKLLEYAIRKRTLYLANTNTIIC